MSQHVADGLKNFQQQLGLKEADVARIEQPIRIPLEMKYQEQLKQQELAEQQRQVELEQRRQKAEYENKLRRYEQEFSRAVQLEYPLSEDACVTLKRLQQTLGLGQEEVNSIEKPLIAPKEAKYQETTQLSVPNATGTSSIVAIQLDTSGFSVAILKDRKASVIPNQQGKLKTPATIACTSKGEWLVGQKAKDQASANPANTFEGILHLLGRRFDEISFEVTSSLPYRVVGDKHGFPKINCSNLSQEFKPEEILAHGLRSLAHSASQHLGWQIKQVVISVPSCFTFLQRKAVREAAKLAGLECLRVTHSSTLAGTAFRISGENETILITDVSENHLVTSVLEVGDGVFEVLSISGKSFLGSREGLQPVLSYLRTSLDDVLGCAKKTKDGIDKIFLTGSSPHMPAIEEQVQKVMNKQLTEPAFSEMAVVLGAAIQAGVLCGLVKDILILDISSLSFGVETLGGVMTKIIPRNTTIPTKKSEVFSTVTDGQTRMCFKTTTTT